jgi:hypothetical protein
MITRKTGISFSFFFLFAGCAGYYILAGYWLQKGGYHHDQALFFSEKALIIYQSKESMLNVLGLTYPTLPFFSILPFLKINPLFAPVISSSIYTALLITFIIWNLISKRQSTLLIVFVLVALLLNPALLYLACSGNAGAMTILVAYMFLKSLFEYIHSNTTYHISIGGLFFVLLVFCNFRFIWLSLFILPLIVLLALNSMRINAETTSQQFILAVNNISLRRKLIGRTYAVFMLVFLLPAGGFFLYELLNAVHAGNPAYFAESTYANWNILDKQLYNNGLLLQMTPSGFFASQDFFSLILKPLFFCPLILPALYLVKKNTPVFFTLLIVFVYLQFLHVYYPDIIPDVTYYLLFLMISIISLLFSFPVNFHNNKLIHIVVPVALLMTILTSWIYLQHSPVSQEKYFSQTLSSSSATNPSTYQDDERMAEFIKTTVPANDIILADDAVAYKVVVFTGKTTHFLLPYQQDFPEALNTPGRMVKYMLINRGSKSASFDMLQLKYADWSSGSNFSLAYESAHWLLLKVNSFGLQ